MESLRGHLLIASPRLLDPNFVRSVVLMVQHDENGALGLVLNRPMDIPIEKAWNQVSASPCLVEGHVHEGGPCEGPLMVLHRRDEHSQMRVIDRLYFSTDRDMIESLVSGGSAPIKFFVGYAGWTAGQLEAELDQGSWLTMPATAEQVFEGPAEQWALLLRLIGRAKANAWLDPRFVPDDPSVN